MRRGLTIAAAVISSVALIGVGAGCGYGDSAAVTPEDATTIANNAPQTDSAGKTVPAPGSDAAQAPAPDAAPVDTGGADGAAAGDVAVGKTVFEANCQGCHPAGGTQAGVGPQLSATALDAAGITNIVTNGQGAMPGGLVSGADLENVVAYVESLKG
jgi:mono/diheme cytochrome c family protein